jgi:hypothetical protein
MIKIFNNELRFILLRYRRQFDEIKALKDNQPILIYAPGDPEKNTWGIVRKMV